MANQRIKLGLTQKQVADYIGISRNHLSNLENNRAKPSNGTLGALIEALQINPDAVVRMLLVGSGKEVGRGPMRPRPRPYH